MDRTGYTSILSIMQPVTIETMLRINNALEFMH